MGLFLAMSAVVGGTPQEIEGVLAAFVAELNGEFSAATGDLSDEECSRQLQSDAGTTFVYPDAFVDWDAASARLSKDLQKPVFSLHIHDGDFWMFVLFVNGTPVAKFNPIPDYWAELPANERAQWLPDPKTIAAHVRGASAQKIAPYLREWSDDESLIEEKAHPDDEFEYGVDWQLVDFMRQLGFKYPEPHEGLKYRFNVE